jgi:hypothetical protein
MLYVHLDGLLKEDNFKEDTPICFKDIQKKSVKHNHICYFYVILRTNSYFNTRGIS